MLRFIGTSGDKAELVFDSTAVLIDSVMLDEGDAQSLANAFGAENTEFSRLIVIHEAISSQTLVVNRLLLAERAKRPTAFVEVGRKTPRLLLHPPSSFAALLETVTSHSADSSFLSLSLPDQSSPLALIPFVGYLLDYAAVYCLDESADGRNCLGGVELVLCEGFLNNSGDR
ncbi:SPOSA6832_03884, partial [Sporobolomyces salmonicolor]